MAPHGFGWPVATGHWLNRTKLCPLGSEHGSARAFILANVSDLQERANRINRLRGQSHCSFVGWHGVHRCGCAAATGSSWG